MDDTPPLTFIFAREIEVSTVSTLWHQPARLPEFLRIIDPLVHLTQPHLRHILEAITLAHGELGIDLDLGNSTNAAASRV
jgi:hypothetical protein